MTLLSNSRAEPANYNNTFTLDEYTRWMCLMESVNLIADKASELGVDLTTSSEWIRVPAIKKFCTARFSTMKRESLKHIVDHGTPASAYA